MTQKISKRKTSLLALALGSLVATSLSAGTTEAASLRCDAQCRPAIISRSDTALHNCVTDCPQKVKKILDTLQSKQNATKKDKHLVVKINTSAKKTLETLQGKETRKNQEISFTQGKLDDPKTKEKEKSKLHNKLNSLSKEQAQLNAQIQAIKTAFEVPAPSQDTVSESSHQPTAAHGEGTPSTSASSPKKEFVSRRDSESPPAPPPPTSQEEKSSKAMAAPTPAPLPPPPPLRQHRLAPSDTSGISSAPLPPPLAATPKAAVTPPPVPPLPPAPPPPLPPRPQQNP